MKEIDEILVKLAHLLIEARVRMDGASPLETRNLDNACERIMHTISDLSDVRHFLEKGGLR